MMTSWRVITCRSRQSQVVSRATRRVVSSPGRGGRSQGSGSRGSESGSGGERGSAGIRWGAMVAAPLCGLLLKTQLDPNSRDWLASLLRSGHDSHSSSGAQLLLQHGVSHAACEAAATPAAEKSDDSVAQTAIELAAEQTHSVAVHDQLLNELERVRAERDALEEQRQALQSALAEHAKRPAATIVQQEIKYSETWDAKIAELLATKTSERVLELMQQPIAGGEDATPSSSLVLGIISDEGLDLSKEPGLAETASVEQAQGRLRALLLELHHRTRLEGVSVAAAIKATEETATRQHLVELSQKMSQQEAYVQSLTETKASEIREATISELRDRDAKFRAQLRLQWAKMNEESLKLGQHNIKLKQLHYSLSRDDDLERAKQDLEIFFTNEAKENSLHLLQAKDKVKNFDQTLENDASKAVHAQLIHRLGLSVQGLVTDLGTQRPLTSHLIALRKLAHADDVVAAVVGSIPATAEKQGVATQEELLERYHGAAHEAVRRLLVPEIGGVAAELLGTVRLRFLQLQGPVLPVTESLVQGSDAKTILQRGHYYVRNGLLNKALEEISSLDGCASFAMSGWVEHTQRRLVVEQAARLLSARVAALTAAMPSA